MTNNPKTATVVAEILVVDDTVASLRLLSDILTQAGYRVRPADSPRLAQQSALAHPPDLILLDIRMPIMSGFELCRNLKQDERTAEIPVIFVSALQDVQDKVRGFEAGGVDFVSKPFEEAEVLARVNTHLQLRNMQLNLEELVAERTVELTEANQELRESEARFRVTFEQAAVGIAHVAPDGRFLRLNQRFSDITSYSREEMLKRTFQDITHPDDLATDLDHLQRLLAGDYETYTLEKRYLRKDGEIVWVNLTVSIARSETDEPFYFISVVEDITERKKLQEERDRILNTSQDLICIAGMDGYFRYLNPAWEDALGYTQAELLSRPFLEFIHPDDHARNDAELEALARGNRTFDFVNRYFCKDGSVRTMSWTAIPLLEEQLMYCFGRDITENRKAEEALRAYQKRLKALASELTLAEERERRRIAADLHDHVSQSLALARIQLSTARKIESGSEREALFDDVSQTLIEAIQSTRTLTFDLSSPVLSELGLETAVSAWLRDQVGTPYHLETEFFDDGQDKPLTEDVRAILFRNVRELLTNIVRHAQAGEIQVTLEREGADIRISIRDDGIGFEPQSVTRQVHPQGGFGLFSIQERMADLGGSLEILSAPGEGCTAVLTVPLDVDD